jgi:hypothetical protein
MQKVDSTEIANVHAAFRDCVCSGDLSWVQTRYPWKRPSKVEGDASRDGIRAQLLAKIRRQSALRCQASCYPQIDRCVNHTHRRHGAIKELRCAGVYSFAIKISAASDCGYAAPNNSAIEPNASAVLSISMRFRHREI